MNFGIVAQQIFTLFIMLFVGYIAKKVGIINEIVNKKLSSLLLYITSPALIFSSYIKEFEHEKLSMMAYIAVGTLFSFIITILLAEKFLFFFIKERTLGSNYKDKITVLKATAVFSNSAYMGFPLILELYGQNGIFYASVYFAMFQLILWTYGIFIYTGKQNFQSIKKALINPALVAVFIGLLVYVFQIKVHASVANASKMIGEMTTPLSMLIIGAIMADVKIRQILAGWVVYYATLIRLVLIPIAAIFIFRWIEFPKDASNIIIVSISMPVAVAVAVFSEQHDKEAVFASKLVTISTLFSMVTIPFVLQLL